MLYILHVDINLVGGEYLSQINANILVYCIKGTDLKKCFSYFLF